MGTHRKPAGFSLTLKMVERVELLRLLERELREIQKESQRTGSSRAPREALDREHILEGLVETLRHPVNSGSSVNRAYGRTSSSANHSRPSRTRSERIRRAAD